MCGGFAGRLIEIRNNLAVIDYSKNDLASRVAIERCPTGAIVWFDKQGGYQVGKDAKKNYPQRDAAHRVVEVSSVGLPTEMAVPEM